MRWTRELYHRLRSLVRVRSADADLDEEMRFHIEMEMRKLVERGHAASDARRLARLSFGAHERFREEAREQRGIGWLEALMRELRLSLRRLLREPTFAAGAVATLAVGLATAVAVFSLVNAVLLSPLPYPDSDRLVVVGHTAAGAPVDGGLSDGLAAWYGDEANSFELMGTVLENEISVTDGDVAEQVRLAMMSPELLAALVPAPALGSMLTRDDAATTPIMISWDLWQRRYGGDPAIIGRVIETNRTPDVVVGVMPRGFDFPSAETDIWMRWPRDDARADVHDLYLTGVARLRPGVGTEDAERELAGLLARVPDRFPDVTPAQLQDAQLRPSVQSLKDTRIADVRAPLMVLLVLVGIVLVITWANVVNLVLLRSERQRREVVIARALGAGAGSLVRRVLVEGALLSTLAGALAVLIAAAAIELRFGFEPDAIPRLHEVALNSRIIGACALLVLATTALLAAVSWMRVRRIGFGGLRPSFARMTASRSTQRTQQVLVGLQVALALVLLVACATTAQSLQRLLNVDMGFDSSDLVVFDINPPARPYLSYGAASALHAAVRDQLATVPGVQRVEGASALPLQSRVQQLRETVTLEGATSEPVTAYVNLVTPGFFDAVGIPLHAGRTFDSHDLTRDTPGIVISAELARQLFGGTDPIGRILQLVGTRSRSLEVVGVSGDVVGETLAGGAAAMLYMPAIFSHGFDPEFRAELPYVPRGLTVIVRTTLPATTLAPTIRRVLSDIDGKIPILALQSADQLVERATARARLITLLLAVASGAALFLGAVGLWGVVAYTLAQRAPELAIRMAVGAQPRSVVGLVLRQGVVVAVLGVLAGGTLAAGLTRSLSAVLFEVESAEPTLFAAAAGVLLVIALAACCAPARRALRVDPATLLRSD